MKQKILTFEVVEKQRKYYTYLLEMDACSLKVKEKSTKCLISSFTRILAWPKEKI